MKTLIDDYIFDKDNKRIIFYGDARPHKIEQMLLVTNVTTGEIIYNFADKLRGGTLENNILTLVWNTSSMSNTDKLQIFIDSDEYHNYMTRTLNHIMKNTNVARDGNDRMRVIMDNSPMLNTYTRNSGTSMNGSGEAFYSISSWNVVDARETLMNVMNQVAEISMRRWTR